MQQYEKLNVDALKYQLCFKSLIFIVLILPAIGFIAYAKNVSGFASLIYILCSIYICVSFVFTILKCLINYKTFRFEVTRKEIIIYKNFILKQVLHIAKNKITAIKIKKNTFTKKLYTIVFENFSNDIIVRNIYIADITEFLRTNFAEKK